MRHKEVRQDTGAQSARGRPLDLWGAIIAYEQGELDEDATRDLFQGLVNTGLAWQLQGHYGRTARAMIDSGEISATPRGRA